MCDGVEVIDEGMPSPIPGLLLAASASAFATSHESLPLMEDSTRAVATLRRLSVHASRMMLWGWFTTSQGSAYTCRSRRCPIIRRGGSIGALKPLTPLTPRHA